MSERIVRWPEIEIPSIPPQPHELVMRGVQAAIKSNKLPQNSYYIDAETQALVLREQTVNTILCPEFDQNRTQSGLVDMVASRAIHRHVCERQQVNLVDRLRVNATAELVAV